MFSKKGKHFALVVTQNRIFPLAVKREGDVLRDGDGKSYLVAAADQYQFKGKDVWLVDDRAARAVNLRGEPGQDDGGITVTPAYLDALVEANDIKAMASVAGSVSWREWLPWAGLGAFVGGLVVFLAMAVKAHYDQGALLEAVHAATNTTAPGLIL